MKCKLAKVLACLLALSAGACAKIESGRNVTQVDWLPGSATNITYTRKTGRLWATDFECSMNRPDFDRYALEKGWRPEEKKDYSTTVRRRIAGFAPVRGNELGMDFYPTALVYEQSSPAGSWTLVLYDPVRERLFFHANSD